MQCSLGSHKNKTSGTTNWGDGGTEWAGFYPDSECSSILKAHDFCLSWAVLCTPIEDSSGYSVWCRDLLDHTGRYHSPSWSISGRRHIASSRTKHPAGTSKWKGLARLDNLVTVFCSLCHRFCASCRHKTVFVKQIAVFRSQRGSTLEEGTEIQGVLAPLRLEFWILARAKDKMQESCHAGHAYGHCLSVRGF